jgi:hypothetical protein
MATALISPPSQRLAPGAAEPSALLPGAGSDAETVMSAVLSTGSPSTAHTVPSSA